MWSNHGFTTFLIWDLKSYLFVGWILCPDKVDDDCAIKPWYRGFRGDLGGIAIESGHTLMRILGIKPQFWKMPSE